jgi:hypothetical protein
MLTAIAHFRQPVITWYLGAIHMTATPSRCFGNSDSEISGAIEDAPAMWAFRRDKNIGPHATALGAKLNKPVAFDRSS